MLWQINNSNFGLYRHIKDSSDTHRNSLQSLDVALYNLSIIKFDILFSR
jgi:hypothetical protein